MRQAFSTVLMLCRSYALQAHASVAVEFAIVFPVALLVYIGAAELSDGIMTSRSLSIVTRSMVDLLSQQPTSSQATSTPTPSNATSASTLSNFATAGQALIYPKSAAPLSITLSAVDVTNNAQGKCCSVLVRWSYTQNGTLRPCAVQLTASTQTSPSPTTIPSSLLPAGTVLTQPLYYLIADTSYAYQPIASRSFLAFSPTMRRTEYMMPRTAGQVTTGSLPGSGSQYGQVCY